jgi:hypothetical protein
VAKYPDCSRISVERKLLVMFKKEKKEVDPKIRWYATEQALGLQTPEVQAELNLIA